jgi:hypothetical protein
MWPNCRSNGVATDEAMISALPPGRLAETEIVGKSTLGKGETGSTLNPIAPAMTMATVISVVATGRSMKGAEMFMPVLLAPHVRRALCRSAGPSGRRRCR